MAILLDRALDLLEELRDEADENLQITLTYQQLIDIQELLDIARHATNRRCGTCNGTGKRTRWNRETGDHALVTCRDCGGHGKLTYKRDAMREPVESAR